MRTRWTDLEFGDARTALLVFVVLLAIALLFLLVSFMRSGSLRGKLGLPAVLPVMRRSPLSLVRHLPLLLFLAGVPFFAVALADPLTGFAREEVSYPGRRIALLVDGSTSMVIRFESAAKRPGRVDLLHGHCRRGAVHPPADERALPRSRRADPVRQLRLCRHAVHQRLREHPAEHASRGRPARVGPVSGLGHDDHRGHRSGDAALSRPSTSSTRRAT